MDRRRFLSSSLAAAAVVALPTIALAKPARPRIVGDGVHDDGPGLNAFLRGEDVEILCPKNVKVVAAREAVGDGWIRQVKFGKFYTSETIRVPLNAMLYENRFVSSVIPCIAIESRIASSEIELEGAPDVVANTAVCCGEERFFASHGAHFVRMGA